MRATRKKSLMIPLGAVLLIVVAMIFVVLRFDINSYKPKIETAISEATGLDARINGSMRLSLFPFGISAHNLHVANRGGEILSLESLKIELKLIPLLKKQLKVANCVLVRPAVTIVKDVEGNYNVRSRAENARSSIAVPCSSHADGCGAIVTMASLKLTL
jgi:AsmA protein